MQHSPVPVVVELLMEMGLSQRCHAAPGLTQREESGRVSLHHLVFIHQTSQPLALVSSLIPYVD